MVLLRREIGGGVGLCDVAEEQEVGGEVGGEIGGEIGGEVGGGVGLL